MGKKEYKICLAGNPNVGKSTIFNGLTGLHQHTGNWAGKTVENSDGICIYNKQKYRFIDIPGTYSIMSDSEEEEIARDYICFGEYDCIVIVVDGTCLERNLNLVCQILEITDRVVLCVNLIDEAKKKEIYIDINKLSKILGIPVVQTVARKKKTLKNLLEKISDVCNNDVFSKKNSDIFKLNRYNEKIEFCIKVLMETLLKSVKNRRMARWIAIKLIENNKNIINKISKYFKINFWNMNEEIRYIRKILNDANISEKNISDILVEEIFKNIEKIIREVIVSREEYSKRDKKIDKILTSKIFGIPLMLFFLGLIFWLTIVGANYPSSLLSNLFSILEQKLSNSFDYMNVPFWIKGILVEGMFRTLGWVISVMLPPMAIFFPLFTLLEDLGYLPRIAFNLDSFFKKVGTTGKQALTMCMGVTMWYLYFLKNLIINKVINKKLL